MQTNSEVERQSNRATCRSKQGVAPLLLTAVVMLLQTAAGGIFPDGSSDAPHVTAGLNFQGGVLWIEGFTFGNTNSFHGSATYLDSYNVLLTTHQLTNQGNPISYTLVGTGNSFSNNPGVAVAIHDIVAYPGYMSDGSTPDLAIAHLSAPLPLPTGPTINISGGPMASTPMTFALVSLGQTVWGTGFGVFGTLSGGLYNPDGNSRAWNAPVDFNAHGFNVSFYFSGNFSQAGALGQMNGIGAPLDSGSPWYDQSGNLVGMAVAASTSGGYTIVEQLSNPLIQSWIQTNLFVPPTLLMQRAGTNVVLTWSGTFTLQTATNLATGFTDVPGAASPYTNAVTADPQRFFRLRLP